MLKILLIVYLIGAIVTSLVFMIIGIRNYTSDILDKYDIVIPRISEDEQTNIFQHINIE